MIIAFRLPVLIILVIRENNEFIFHIEKIYLIVYFINHSLLCNHYSTTFCFSVSRFFRFVKNSDNVYWRCKLKSSPTKFK